MDQFSLYAIERHGASAVPSFTVSALHTTRGHEESARHIRMLHHAAEASRFARLERRRRRLQSRITALESRLESVSASRGSAQQGSARGESTPAIAPSGC